MPEVSTEFSFASKYLVTLTSENPNNIGPAIETVERQVKLAEGRILEKDVIGGEVLIQVFLPAAVFKDDFPEILERKHSVKASVVQIRGPGPGGGQ